LPINKIYLTDNRSAHLDQCYKIQLLYYCSGNLWFM
jgi:hypothetical protein